MQLLDDLMFSFRWGGLGSTSQTTLSGYYNHGKWRKKNIKYNILNEKIASESLKILETYQAKTYS